MITSHLHFFYILGATISAPPTTNNAISGGSVTGEGSKVATIVTTGAASKIIHPAEDISLEEIRARQPKYARSIPSRNDETASNQSSSASDVSINFSKTLK